MNIDNTGTLFLVPTPIGNLRDITLRSLDVLRSADVVLCEDTRHTRALLTHHGISQTLVSYHKYTDRKKEDYICSLLQSGKSVALVSNAGTPLIADPGLMLVKRVIAEGNRIEALPGASAVITALLYTGMNPDQFVFAGWMPRKEQQKKKIVERFASLEMPIVFLESPHRIQKTIATLATYFPTTYAVLVREMTKMYEEALRGTLTELLQKLTEHPVRGEIVLIIDGTTPTTK